MSNFFSSFSFVVVMSTYLVRLGPIVNCDELSHISSNVRIFLFYSFRE